MDWYIDQINQGYADDGVFPGLFVTKGDMKDFNTRDLVKRDPSRYRQLVFYRLRGSPDLDDGDVDGETITKDLLSLKEKEDSGEFDNLYACAHMYACDKNSLFLPARALDRQIHSAMASLSMTVIFHQRDSVLRMIYWDAAFARNDGSLPTKWFIQEAWTPASGDNRVSYETRLWDPNGRLLATTLQDGQLRVAPPDDSKL